MYEDDIEFELPKSVKAELENDEVNIEAILGLLEDAAAGKISEEELSAGLDREVVS